MKKLILISALLLIASNGWAEVKNLECKETFSWDTEDNVPLRIDDAPYFITIDVEKKIWYTGNIELPLLSNEEETFFSASNKDLATYWVDLTFNRMTGEATKETRVTYVKYICELVKPLW